MRKYDIHTHILPGIDDGARNIQKSLELVATLNEQGVTHIGLTPHFYSNSQSIEDFLEKREKAYNEFISKAPNNITYTLGAEVYMSEYLFNNKDLKDLCYEGTNYLLVEFPYNATFQGKSESMMYKLINDYNVIPIIAHIERYSALLNNHDLVGYLKGIGCLMQINLSSLEQFSTRRKLFKFVSEGLISFIGSDIHSMNKGANFANNFNMLAKKFPDFEEKLFDEANSTIFLKHY